MKNNLKKNVITIAVIAALTATVFGCGTSSQETSANTATKGEVIEKTTVDEKALKEAEANKYYDIGVASLYGLNGTKISLENAYNNFMKANELGNIDSNFYLGLLYGDYEYPQNDMDMAKKYFDACQNSEKTPYAQIYLSNMYYFGNGVDEDKDKAASILKEVIAQGYVEGCIEPYIYESDKSKYVEEYKKAVDGKEQFYIATAMQFIGEAYYNGNNIEQDYEKAVEWLEKAADLGNRTAIKDLGVIYYYGNGVEQSYDKALAYFEKAAELNEKEAIHTMGYMYNMGIGVEQDYKKAAECYEKAANLGQISSMNNLGFLYDNGNGVEQDYKKAAEWYTKSAEKGNAMAMTNLSGLYYNGYGVEQDYEKALDLLTQAVNTGELNAQTLRNVQNEINTIKKLIQ